MEKFGEKASDHDAKAQFLRDMRQENESPSTSPSGGPADDAMIEALVEVVDYWKNEKSSAEREYKYIGHPLDELIIYRSVLVAMLYLYGADCSWLMDRNADWNRVVSFL